MTGYTDLTISTKDLYDGYTAPEEIRDRARDAWERMFAMSGLTARASEMNKDHRQGDGRYVLGWFVGTDEYYYYVVFDPNEHRVITEKHGRAVKREQGEEGSS